MMNLLRATLFLVACLWATASHGQGNTFPASGNVGIGVSPGAKLHVRVTTKIERQSGGYNHFLFVCDEAGNYITTDDPGTNHKNLYIQAVSRENGSNVQHIYFQTGPKNGTLSTRLFVHGSGNVGIGTTNPQAKLAVNGNILAKEIKIKTDITVPDYV